MTRREFSWNESEHRAGQAYMQVLRAEGIAVTLPSAMEKSPIRQNGRPRYYKGDGSVQEVTRSIKVFSGIKDFTDFVEVQMVGQRWRGSSPRTYWHVTEATYHSNGRKTEYCYDYGADVHDPYWQGWPRERDLCKVMPDGTLQRRIAA